MAYTISHINDLVVVINNDSSAGRAVSADGGGAVLLLRHVTSATLTLPLHANHFGTYKAVHVSCLACCAICFSLLPQLPCDSDGCFALHSPILPSHVKPQALAACLYKLGLGTWTDQALDVPCTLATAASFASCGGGPQRRWHFAPEAAACGARRYERRAAQRLLAGARLVFAGDSIARHLYGALLRLAGGPGQEIPTKAHADFNHTLVVERGQEQLPGASSNGGIQTFFYWRPYPANLTGLLAEWRNASSGGNASRMTATPHAAVLSASLWHMLHVRNATEFGQALHELLPAANALVKGNSSSSSGDSSGGSSDGRSKGLTAGPPRLVLALSTDTFPAKMSTPLKQQNMQPSAVMEYNSALLVGDGGSLWAAETGAGANCSAPPLPLLAPAGPFLHLDMYSITHTCGEGCTIDGVHSQPEVYDAALQVLLSIWAAERPAVQPADRQPSRRQKQQ